MLTNLDLQLLADPVALLHHVLYLADQQVLLPDGLLNAAVRRRCLTLGVHHRFLALCVPQHHFVLVPAGGLELGPAAVQPTSEVQLQSAHRLLLAARAVGRLLPLPVQLDTQLRQLLLQRLDVGALLSILGREAIRLQLGSAAGDERL